MDNTGAVVMGRTGFEENVGTAAGAREVRSAIRPASGSRTMHPNGILPTVYTFVTDGVASALEQAKTAAGDRVVHLHGATIMPSKACRSDS